LIETNAHLKAIPTNLELVVCAVEEAARLQSNVRNEAEMAVIIDALQRDYEIFDITL
jgi:hypothetical protein